MSKAVLLSVQPQWCEKIASGEKAVEVRKSKPKLNAPFKCYIYCTKSKKRTRIDCLDKALPGGMVIGEFVCDRIYQYASDLFRSAPVEGVDISTEEMVNLSCLTAKELYEYEHSEEPRENCINLVGIYGWRISDLKIYDKPKDISEFFSICKEHMKGDPRCGNCDYYQSMGEYPPECACDGVRYLWRAPQSWCYVEELT